MEKVGDAMRGNRLACSLPMPFCRLAQVLIVVLLLELSVSACDAKADDERLERSRLQIIDQVRHVRGFSHSGVTVGDTVTGGYSSCGGRAVKYLARTDWVDIASDGSHNDMLLLLANDFKKDGWSISSSPGGLAAKKPNFTADLAEYPSQSIVKAYVAGRCIDVGDSSRRYLKKSAERIDG